MQQITPFLWFDSQAEEAANFYVSLFKGASIDAVHRHGENGPAPAGSAMMVVFHLFGQKFMALNGGPHYAMTPAISFMVDCESQEEIDLYWEKLGDGGKYMECGWVTDRFNVTWQIVPSILGELMGGDNPERSQRVMQALWKMQKLDIGGLKAAYDG